MPPIRFRLRTIMVVIAAIAVLLCVVRAVSGLRVWVDMREENTVLSVDIEIPLVPVIFLVALVLVSLALYAYYRDNWMRPGKASTAANRPIERAEPAQSGEAEKV
jgi:hypothetical protein